MNRYARPVAVLAALAFGVTACGVTASVPTASSSSSMPTASSAAPTVAEATVTALPVADTVRPPMPTFPPSAASAKALDLHAQTVFGIGIGYASADQVLVEITAQLGPVTSDTGWHTRPADAGDDGGSRTDCIDRTPSRTLRWGDLSFVFFDSPFGLDGEFLWAWSIGDVPLPISVVEPEGSSQPAPTGLRSAEGIAIGSPTSDLDGVYGGDLRLGPDVGHELTDRVIEVDQVTGSTFLLRTKDDAIAGMSASFSFAGPSGQQSCSAATGTRHQSATSVVLIGDSLAEQSAPYLQSFLGGTTLIAHVFGGTSPCDWLGRDLGIHSDSVVVISFSGNSLTACMSNGVDGSLAGADLIAKYRQDVTALIAEALYVGASVLLVGQPVHDGTPASNEVVTAVNDLYVQLAGGTNTAFVDAGMAVEAPDGTFAKRLPCWPSEPWCDSSGTNTVRNDDGVHFCPGPPRPPPCPVYSSGAFRFAAAIERATRDL